MTEEEVEEDVEGARKGDTEIGNALRTIDSNVACSASMCEQGSEAKAEAKSGIKIGISKHMSLGKAARVNELKLDARTNECGSMVDAKDILHKEDEEKSMLCSHRPDITDVRREGKEGGGNGSKAKLEQRSERR